MQSSVKIDASLIPPEEVRRLAVTFLEFFSRLCEDPDLMQEFENWKAQRKHKQYT